MQPNSHTESITLGGGCFWCVEAVLQQFKGVEKVESGYAGGNTKNPTYDQVSRGDTGHVEVVQVFFDPQVISLKQVLTIFFHAHDPTTKDRQGNDVGSQYRSAVLYENEAQHPIVDAVVKEIQDAKVWGAAPIVTEVKPLDHFYPAEEYHQNYYKNNPEQGYCSIVIGPKVQKVRKEFSQLLK